MAGVSGARRRACQGSAAGVSGAVSGGGGEQCGQGGQEGLARFRRRRRCAARGCGGVVGGCGGGGRADGARVEVVRGGAGWCAGSGSAGGAGPGPWPTAFRPTPFGQRPCGRRPLVRRLLGREGVVRGRGRPSRPPCPPVAGCRRPVARRCRARSGSRGRARVLSGRAGVRGRGAGRRTGWAWSSPGLCSPRGCVPLAAVCRAAGPAVPRGPGRAVLGQGVGAVFSRWRRASWEAGSSGR